MDIESKPNPEPPRISVGEEDAGYKALEERHLYNFPFPPYDIQVSLMRAAYQVFEESKFALLESPTGTGKSLSLICSSLTWLKDHQKKTRDTLSNRMEELTSKIEDLKKAEELSEDWLGAQSKRQTVIKELSVVKQELERLERFELRQEARRHSRFHHKPLDNYQVMQEKKAKIVKESKLARTVVETKLLADDSVLEEAEEEQENIEMKIKDLYEEDRVAPKIYYASRTHSQLTQFIGEIKKTSFAKDEPDHSNLLIKLAPLASRPNLCINPDVIKLKDGRAINERCAELQRETSANKKCPFLKAKQVASLKEDILGSVQDIEDIVRRGRTLAGCPYYATRMATAEADMVVLPYNNLLHQETRKASSLDLKDSLVIIDEAHNILETICSIHSATITGHQLIGAHTILTRYYLKFHNRMAPRNAAMIKTIVECITALIMYLNLPSQHHIEFEGLKNVDNMMNDDTTGDANIQPDGDPSKNGEEHMTAIDKFIRVAKLEQYNVFKIIDYFDRSQLARKLQGMFKQNPTFDLGLNLDLPQTSKEPPKTSDKRKRTSVSPSKKRQKFDSVEASCNTTNECNHLDKQTATTSLKFITKHDPILNQKESNIQSYPIYPLIEFLKTLTHHPKDGKILTKYIKNDIQQSSLKFILLNPSRQFQQMTEEARSIVLAGGTMQPFNEFLDLLFGPLKIKPERLTTFSCGHVISQKQLFIASLANGSSGKPLELSYKCRSTDSIDEIGRTILLIASSVPGGMVCFLPSYEYEKSCFSRWTQSGLISNIETKFKQVFREPKLTNHMKPVLDEYSRVVAKSKATGRGALLMCVVGGKMSEGINFNDDLGRCVVMVGLPYANIKSGELQEKMSFYDRVSIGAAAGSQIQRGAGQQYYENLCIKGINQSIGRAIRHREDYASIILLDRRYLSKTNVRTGLPTWMQESLVDFERFGPMLGQLKAFFSRMGDKPTSSTP